ncbi:MAG: hypothetical protein WD825_14535 [Gemmatimonadaceae bacterium]
MAVRARLSQRLHDALGAEAAEDMVSLVEELRAEREAADKSRAELANAVKQVGDDVRGLELRLTKEIAGVKTELVDRIDGVQTGLLDRIDDVKTHLTERIGETRVEIAQSRADLIRWSFVFWVGAVAAIAMLAGVLGR